MQKARWWCSGALVLWAGLSGCGYPGDPLPPALNRPTGVRDLAAVERGEKVVIHFTIPTRTLEDLPLKGEPDVELRIGAAPGGRFDVPEWEQSSKRVGAGDIHVNKLVASAEVPAREYYGKSVVIGVRVHGPGGRDAGWSNFEVVPVIPALATPQALSAKDAPDAVRLEWNTGSGLTSQSGTGPEEFRVFRREATDADWALAGNSKTPVFLDDGIQFGKSYRYFVQGVAKTGDGIAGRQAATFAESEPSAEIEFQPVDRFPPAVPVGLSAIPGTRTIELVWERNPEKDFAAYRIYRDGQKLTDSPTAPAFSDRDVKVGTKYRYQVSAVDTAGNESALSGAVETAIP